MKIVEYLTDDGSSPFQKWFDALESRAAAKVTSGLIRLGMGNTSNAKSVGGGVHEYKIMDPATVSISEWTEVNWSS